MNFITNNNELQNQQLPIIRASLHQSFVIQSSTHQIIRTSLHQSIKIYFQIAFRLIFHLKFQVSEGMIGKSETRYDFNSTVPVLASLSGTV